MYYKLNTMCRYHAIFIDLFNLHEYVITMPELFQLRIAESIQRQTMHIGR